MKPLLILAAGSIEAEALRAGLRYAPNCRVMGFFDVRLPCERIVEESRPEVILIDDAGCAETTLSRVREARQAAPTATIVCRAKHEDAAWGHSAAEAGADATVDVSLDGARMGLLVREIAAGTVFHAPRATRPGAGKAPEAAAGLTARELQILKLAASGFTNSRIAQELWVTEQTVKFHLSNVYRKLGLANRTEAARYAHVHGLVDAGDPTGPLPIAA
ncbi:MAG TPA: response regulator transcription factor [Baekduia sp.]|nr:response regulator transcription factor [Baekduia sp.]